MAAADLKHAVVRRCVGFDKISGIKLHRNATKINKLWSGTVVSACIVENGRTHDRTKIIELCGDVNYGIF